MLESHNKSPEEPWVKTKFVAIVRHYGFTFSVDMRLQGGIHETEYFSALKYGSMQAAYDAAVLRRNIRVPQLGLSLETQNHKVKSARNKSGIIGVSCDNKYWITTWREKNAVGVMSTKQKRFSITEFGVSSAKAKAISLRLNKTGEQK